MIEDLIYFSPYIALFCGILLLWLGAYYNNALSWNFKIAKITTFSSFVLTLVFYNKSAFPDYMNADLFAFVFKIIIFISVLAVLFVSRKWYAGMNGSGHQFCLCMLLALIAGNLLIESKNLTMTTVAVVLLMMTNFLLFNHADKRKEIYLSSNIYAVTALVMCVPLIGALLYFSKEAGAVDYATLAVFTDLYSKSPIILLLLSGLVLVFAFLLAVAPLHFWFTETMGQVILPVFTYFTLVPVVACWAGFIRFNVVVLSAVQPMFELFYFALALLALFIGAIGTCSGKNVRKILAYSSVFHTGVMLAVLPDFSLDNINADFVYLFVYMVAMYGICASLYTLKIKGEYLFMLSDYEGAATKCPYTSALLSMFLFSLIGFPPFAGCLGTFSAMSSLIANEHYYLMITILALMMVVVYSYLQIIKTLYFENSHENFDRADRGIYAVLMFILALMLVIVLKPCYLVQDICSMLEDVFKWLM